MAGNANIATVSEILLPLGLSGTVTDEQRAIVQESRRWAEGQVRRYLQYDPVSASRTEYYPNMDLTAQRRGLYEVTETEAYLRFVQEAATDELQLKHIPVRSISSLKVDYDGRAGSKATSFSATAWIEGTDYWPNYNTTDSDGNKICTDGIIRSEGRWPVRPGSILVVYTAGYTDKEFRGQVTGLDATPILEVVIDESVRKFHSIWNFQRKRAGAGFAGPLSSESMGDYSYSVDTSLRNMFLSGGSLSDQSREKLADFARWDVGVL